MIQKMLYPKTIRINDTTQKVFLTEKLDGSNIGFFRIEDELIISTRNQIYTLSEFSNMIVPKDSMNKSLSVWLSIFGENLKWSLHKNSGFFGEFLTKRKIKYPEDEFPNKVYMYAKANLDDELNISNIFYDHSLFKFPFIEEEIPRFISVVPIVMALDHYPKVIELDDIYTWYCKKVDRKVEGFIVGFQDNIRKYVRYKNGKATKHTIKGE